MNLFATSHLSFCLIISSYGPWLLVIDLKHAVCFVKCFIGYTTRMRWIYIAELFDFIGWMDHAHTIHTSFNIIILFRRKHEHREFNLKTSTIHFPMMCFDVCKFLFEWKIEFWEFERQNNFNDTLIIACQPYFGHKIYVYLLWIWKARKILWWLRIQIVMNLDSWNNDVFLTLFWILFANYIMWSV